MLGDERPVLRTSAPLYAQVLIPRHITKSFTYVIPPALRSAIVVGQRVLVPFGHATLEGAVISLSHLPPADVRPGILKEVRALAEGTLDGTLSATLLELTRKVSDEYVAPWGQCLRLIVPPVKQGTAGRVRYVATPEGRAVLKDPGCPEPLRPLLARIARRSTGVLSSTLLGPGRRSLQALETLSSNGWITRASPEADVGGVVRPRAARKAPTKQVAAVYPSVDQDLWQPDPHWLACIEKALTCPGSQTVLVHAPWRQRLGLLVGIIDRIHARNQSAIILCGEVAKAQWMGQVLQQHTARSVKIRTVDEGPTSGTQNQGGGESAGVILVGTRSTVFAPLSAVGLIWVDGEDDPALKEPQEPRYHGRDVAWRRAQLEGALLVLASAHPSMESYGRVRAESCLLHQPPGGPAIHLVDLRKEPAKALLSPLLVQAMEEAVAAKARVVLFLNRKGYAGALACRDCGWVPRCPSCAVACTYYRTTARLACRYCGHESPLPDLCASCGAARLTPVGEGTERVELEVRRLLPHARVLRLDGDTVRRPMEARRLWDQLYSGEFDVVVGTQVLFQRAPVPPVGLVGIVHADAGLHVPDFRAAERTYQVLVDAASWARSEVDGGRVIVQTLLPTHHAIESVVLGQPHRFYEEELAARQLLEYPPARHLASLSVSGRQAKIVDTAARAWRVEVEQTVDSEGQVAILGPVPALGGRPVGHYRQHMLVKGTDRTGLCRAIRRSVEQMERDYTKAQAKFVVDVDPMEMG